MELVKKLKEVIAIVLIVLVLVVIRSSGPNHFKNNAKKWAEPSVTQSNTITIEKAGVLTGKILIINLDKIGQPGEVTFEVQNISPDSVLSKKHISTIMKHDGPVLLSSSEPGLSARIWMIFSQMGCENIYILTDKTDNEVFKYKFHPDSSVVRKPGFI